MTEILAQPSLPERVEMTQDYLLALGDACVAAANRTDLAGVAAEHAAFADNPNVFGEPGSGILFNEGDVPTSDTTIVRQVGREAIEDLATSGIVRNAATAQGREHHRWGHDVFWNAGKDGKSTLTGGRFVLETTREAGETGWVTADKVVGIHAQMPDGRVQNILKPQG